MKPLPTIAGASLVGFAYWNKGSIGNAVPLVGGGALLGYGLCPKHPIIAALVGDAGAFVVAVYGSRLLQAQA